MKYSYRKIKEDNRLAKNKKNNKGFDKKTLLTGIVAIISIFIISIVADNAIKTNFVYEKNPCRLIKCGAVPQVDANQIGLNEKTQNVICQCPNRPSINYEVARVRMY